MSTFTGHVIKEIRLATDEEIAEEGWESSPHPLTVVVMDNGAKMYASRDGEGNGPGAMFGRDPEGNPLYVTAGD